MRTVWKYVRQSTFMKKIEFHHNFTQENTHSKHEHEYQEVCAELQPIYGKKIWLLPWKPFCTEYKLRKAHEIAKKRGIQTFAYLVGIIKKL